MHGHKKCSLPINQNLAESKIERQSKRKEVEMPVFAKFVITAGCYLLLYIGLSEGATWLVIVGAFMAGSATTKLVAEWLAKSKAKLTPPQTP